MVNPHYKLFGSWESLGGGYYALWVGPKKYDMKLRVVMNYIVQNRYCEASGAMDFWEFILTATQEEVDLATVAFKIGAIGNEQNQRF